MADGLDRQFGERTRTRTRWGPRPHRRRGGAGRAGRERRAPQYMDYSVRDDRWARVEPLSPGEPSGPGRTAADNRLFLDAVLWIACTGAPWPALPWRFGKCNSVFQRFNW